MTDEEYTASLQALTDKELKARITSVMDDQPRLIAVLAESSRRRREKDWREWQDQNIRYALKRRETTYHETQKALPNKREGQ